MFLFCSIECYMCAVELYSETNFSAKRQINETLNLEEVVEIAMDPSMLQTSMMVH